jgi:hypothetical protein
MRDNESAKKRTRTMPEGSWKRLRQSGEERAVRRLWQR